MGAVSTDPRAAGTSACPFCGSEEEPQVLAQAWWADSTVVQRLIDEHPTWRLPDGACPACLQEVLLHVLLTQGDAALHEQVQILWPLDARAAFGAIPTPMRLHADPRFTGRGVTIALIDAGFHPHADLTQPLNRIRAWVDASAFPTTVLRFAPDEPPTWPQWDTGRNRQWHGTMTSVVTAGNGARSHGLYRGLASDAELILIQVTNDAHGITDDAIVRALRWTAEHAKEFGIRVVNLSIGGASILAPPDNPIDDAVRDLVALGVTVIAAAGNDAVRCLAPPASAPDALTVGGLDDHSVFSHDEIELWHSNYGTAEDHAQKPELAAPSIWVAAPVLPGSGVEAEAQQLFAQRHRGPDAPAVERRIAELKLITPYYQHVDGTSFAAPLVAGVVACMLEANPALSPGIIRQMLLATAQPVAGATRARQGAGAVSAGRAVAEALRHRHPELATYPALPHVGAATVTFVFHDHAAHTVELFGSWDGWSAPRAMQQDAPGVWRSELPRPAPGRHAYKYRIDGVHWLDDSANPRKSWDGSNGFNSLLIVD